MFPVPARRRRIFRLTPDGLFRGEGTDAVRLFHLAERDGGLVCAAGFEEMPKDYPDGATAVYAAPGEQFLYYPDAKEAGKGALYGVHCRGDWLNMKIPPVTCIALFEPRADIPSWFVMTENGVYFYSADRTPVGAAASAKAKYGAAYAERMFAVSDTRIMNSPAMSDGIWEVAEDGTRDGYQQLDLPLYHGKYVGCAAFGGSFYIFCERGILALRMGGETLAGRIEDIPYGCGKVAEGSVVLCGNAAVFATGEGLFSFNGNGCKRLSAPLFSELDLGQPFTAGEADGVYFLHCTKKGGGRVLYAYDAVRERESLLRIEADSFAAAGGAYFLKDGVLYRLNGRGLPSGGEGCTLAFTLTETAREGGCAEWVRIDGAGSFEVTARDKHGRVATARGAAGKRLPFTADLGGALEVEITCRQEDFRIAGLAFGIGEDGQYDD